MSQVPKLPSQSQFRDSVAKPNLPAPAAVAQPPSTPSAVPKSEASLPTEGAPKEKGRSKLGTMADKTEPNKEAAKEARNKEIAKKAAEVAAASYAGEGGRKAVDALSKTKLGDKVLTKAGKKIGRKIDVAKTTSKWVLPAIAAAVCLSLLLPLLFIAGLGNGGNSDGPAADPYVNPETVSPSKGSPGATKNLEVNNRLALYKEIAAEKGLPWQSLASLAQVLTQQGTVNPFLAQDQVANESTPSGLFLIDPANRKVPVAALLPDEAEQIRFIADQLLANLKTQGYTPSALAEENYVIRDKVWLKAFSALPIAWPTGGGASQGYQPIGGTYALGPDGKIFIIGDSISQGFVGTSEFSTFFSNSVLPRAVQDTLVGRRIGQGTVAASTYGPKAGDVLIVFLGTNNYTSSAVSIEADVTEFMVKANGARVLWITPYLPTHPTEQANLLGSLKAVAAVYPNLQLVDWGTQGVTSQEPTDPLGIHPKNYSNMAKFVIAQTQSAVLKDAAAPAPATASTIAASTPSVSTPVPGAVRTGVMVPEYGAAPPGARDIAPNLPAGGYEAGSLPGPVQGTAVNGDSVAVPAPAVGTSTLPPVSLIFPVAGLSVKNEPWNFGLTNARPQGRWHQGFDIMAAKGLPVIAACSGEVVIVNDYEPGDSRPNWVGIGCQDNNKYGYGHLDTVSVQKGQMVTAGQLIGTVGNTGTSAFHLHFSINERQVVGPSASDSNHPSQGPYVINPWEALSGSISIAAPYAGGAGVGSAEGVSNVVLLQARAYGGLSPKEDRDLPTEDQLKVSLRAGSTSIGSADPATVAGLMAVGVPQDVAIAIAAHPAECPEYTPSLQVAQAFIESSFDTHAVSDAGALGVAQFMPFTWPTYQTDGDGDGRMDPFDPDDAIAAKGKFMCHLVSVARERGKTEVMKEALRYYNCGEWWERNPSKCKNGWNYALKIVELAETKYSFLTAPVAIVPANVS